MSRRGEPRAGTGGHGRGGGGTEERGRAVMFADRTRRAATTTG